MNLTPNELAHHCVADLAAYGYSLTEQSEIRNPSGKATGVRVQVAQRGRLQVRSFHSNALLWSGPRITDFLESFWFAKRLPA